MLRRATVQAAARHCVLVVDDDPTIQLLISSVLEDAGYRVFTAGDGREALGVLNEVTIDCIVSDVNMPHMSGFELCELVRLRPDGKRIVILFLTGLNDYESITRAYEVGANDFALKQSNPALLVERVRFLLRTQEMQDELRSSEQRLVHAQRLAMLGHWECNSKGESISISPVVCEMLGLPEGTPVSWKLLCEKTHPADLAEMQSTVRKAVADRSTFALEHRVVSDAGFVRILRHVGEVGLDAHNQFIMRSTVQDVTEARAQNERIRFLAFHDPLTALPNRESAMQLLSVALQRSGSGPGTHIAVFCVAVDDFDKVAGSLGRKLADALIKTIGDRLRNQLRASEHGAMAPLREDELVVARGDGDGFLCFVSRLRVGEGAIEIAEHMQRIIAAPLKLGDMELRLTASIGVSFSPNDGRSAVELIDNASAALFHGRGIKGSLQFFATEISIRARQRLALEAQLRQALDLGQFELHYQPRVRLSDGVLAGMEALVRWRHPTRGLVMPDAFISVMEETGMISELGCQVIDMAVRQAARWRRSLPPGFRVSFNVSPLQFIDNDPVKEVDAAVLRHGAHHDNLEAEITEGALMDQPASVTRALHAFRERGLRIALDDFGTGYSSLSYLRTLPLDVLKVDRSFVKEIGASHGSSSLVRAILSMAQALGLECVGEGIETEAQRSFLGANRCQEAQGYLIARPMSVPDFDQWMLGQPQGDRADLAG
jgi:diguanylate cyclase (GGDEF)-like protein